MNHLSNETLQNLLDESNSISMILRKLKISETCPYNRKRLKERMKNLDQSKFEINKKENCPFYKKERYSLSDNDFFCLDKQRVSGTHIKKRLLESKKWKNECKECGLKDEWNGKPISLHVDHINGNATDNRLENLRFLCPNCHSQTQTFAGKNRGKNNNHDLF